MFRRQVISGLVAGAVLLAPNFATAGQSTAVNRLMAQANSSDGPEVPVEVPEVPSVMDPPESRIPEQIYPCNPGSFEPSVDLQQPDPPAFADNCENVIEPPPTNDTEIEVAPPAADAGTMPIKPNEIDPD